jgi:Icc-related predicted phosphoesterase
MTVTRFVIISDTHNEHAKLASLTDAGRMPAGDVLIYCGDISRHGTISEIESFNSWLSVQPYERKIGICGNHDLLFQQDRKKALELLNGGITLFDQELLLPVKGRETPLKIWGTPWNPWFHDWAFNLPRGPQMAAVWAQVPDDVDILVTHTPPHGILDEVNNRHGSGSIGCESLRERVEEIAFVEPWKWRLNCFGHIHEGRGYTECHSTRWLYVNASNSRRSLTSPPYVVDYDSEAERFKVVENQDLW